MQPLVSHFIISYNEVDFIAEAIQSAIDQDYENLEVIVADDGSTDGTREIILAYARKYPNRLIPVVGGPNLGITGNCNRALAHCRGTYISCQGGDDVLLPGKISRQVAWLEADQRRVLCGHDVRVIFTQAAGKEFVQGVGAAGRDGVGAGKIIRGGVDSFFMGTSLMFRATNVPRAGFDSRLPIVSDWKFMVDVVGINGVWGSVDGVFALYRRHQSNITRIGLDRIFSDISKTIKLLKVEHPDFREDIKYANVELLYFFAKRYYENGLYMKSKRIFSKLLFYDRRHHKQIPTYKICKFILKNRLMNAMKRNNNRTAS